MPRTIKLSKISWRGLPQDTKRRALQIVLGSNFREFLVKESDLYDFIFWEILEKNIKILPFESGYKLLIYNKIYIN